MQKGRMCSASIVPVAAVIAVVVLTAGSVRTRSQSMMVMATSLDTLNKGNVSDLSGPCFCHDPYDNDLTYLHIDYKHNILSNV